MTTFKHPADALRARVLGELDCLGCEHFTAHRTTSWCGKQGEDPAANKPDWGYCEEFKHKKKLE